MLMRVLGIIVSILSIRVAVVHGWYATWGSVPMPTNVTSHTESFTFNNHTEYFGFSYGTSAYYMFNVCLKSFRQYAGDREQCEEFVDKVNKIWHHISYAPGMYSPQKLDQVEYLVTRGVVLSMLGERFNYRSYLEIGTDQDQIFREARTKFEIAVGVDPLSGGTLRMTSDEFFATNQQYFDLIFVDGLHEAYQTYADVINSLKWLNPGGTIVMHDCNPHGLLKLRASFPPPDNVKIWNGDSWKAVVALRYREDLDLVVVDVDHGVAVVRKKPNQHQLSSHWKQQLGDDPMRILNDETLANHRLELLPLVTMSELELWLDGEVGTTQEVDVPI